MSRRLAFHGLLLFLLSMVEGMFVQRMANPRMGLSAHVGGAMSGIFLVALACVWSHVRLGPRATSVAFWSALIGFYMSSLGLCYAAIFATRDSTPLHGAATPAATIHEGVAFALTGGGGVLVLCACALLVWSLRGRA